MDWLYCLIGFMAGAVTGVIIACRKFFPRPIGLLQWTRDEDGDYLFLELREPLTTLHLKHGELVGVKVNKLTARRKQPLE